MQRETKKCIYCRRDEELATDKSYCLFCEENMYMECIKCHLPYDSPQYFTLHDHRCNSCQAKYEKEKLLRELTSGKSGTLSDEEDNTNKSKSLQTNIRQQGESAMVSDDEIIAHSPPKKANIKKEKKSQPKSSNKKVGASNSNVRNPKVKQNTKSKQLKLHESFNNTCKEEGKLSAKINPAMKDRLLAYIPIILPESLTYTSQEK